MPFEYRYMPADRPGRHAQVIRRARDITLPRRRFERAQGIVATGDKRSALSFLPAWMGAFKLADTINQHF